MAKKSWIAKVCLCQTDTLKSALEPRLMFRIPGLVELTHNYGTENDPNYKVANGNSEPGKGFGHLCISVDNIQAACQRIEDVGYKFQKKLTDGRMKSIAFALDPDSYWVEVIGQRPVEQTENTKETDPETYRMVSTSANMTTCCRLSTSRSLL